MATKNTGKKAVNNTGKNQEEAAAVAQAVSKSEEFLTTYKKPLTYTLVGLVLLVCIGFAYAKFVREPRREEALGQMFTAESYFRTDSFNLALNGDGNALGFKDVIEKYKALPGKVVYFYAGVCELQLGNFNEAISYLNKYNANDDIIQARAYCNLGDAYVGLEDLNKGLSYYLKAANYKDNMYAAGYYLKAGIIYEELGDKAKALELYKIIKNDYPQTLEGYEIDKYISRIEFAE